eukprot:TRINITY_DN7585_c0_g1_i1.p1 TRINITY_DN7585_c0_g1~~TRINITY_DN7585_c0_g1_i1.p1  ORF type:complete len:399 (+),score=95.87 TRINITY_DN7585_c0_g1_i1:72-1199(+)
MVIDAGSGALKAGLADQATGQPSVVFPSLVGHPRRNVAGLDDTYVGSAVVEHRGQLTVKRPVVRGLVTDWDDHEAMLERAFAAAHASPAGQPVLMTEAPFNPRRQREQLTRLMFEQFGVPGLYLSLPAALSLYASGMTGGVVIECGDGITSCVPCHEGYPVETAIVRVDIAGADLTDYMARLLGTLADVAVIDREVAADVKERLAFVAVDGSTEIEERTYALPDGRELAVGSERFLCPEALFHPSCLGVDTAGMRLRCAETRFLTDTNEAVWGVHQACYDAVMRCEAPLRDAMFGNILLAGGTALLPGYAERMHRELARLVPDAGILKVTTARECKYAAWIGGSCLASLSTFQQLWMSKKDYDENGTSIVFSKCF